MQGGASAKGRESVIKFLKSKELIKENKIEK
jgi:hypothetical protein